MNLKTKLSYGEITKLLRKLEKERHLLERYAYQGFCLWPVIRQPLAVKMANLQMASFKRGKKIPSYAKRAVRMLKGGLALCLRFPLIRNKILFITASSEWRIESQEGTKSIYYGDLIRSIPNSAVVEVVNTAPLSSRPNQRAFTVVGSLNFVEDFVRITSLFLLKLGFMKNVANTITLELSSFGSEFDRTFLEKHEIQKKLCIFVASFHWYRLVWSLLKPERIVLTCAYGKEGLIAAAKSRSMPVIELQHGAISHEHFAYSYDSEDLQKCDATPFPNLFCLYGDYWLERMKGFGYWDGETSNALVCGSIELDRVRSIGQSSERQGVVKTIILTTQGVHNEELIFLLSDLVKRLKGKWHLIIRTHPLNNSKNIERWINSVKKTISSIEIELSLGNKDHRPTNEMISSADWHMSIFSTCHYEALGLGVPTIVLPLPGAEYMNSLRGLRGVFFPQSSREICETLEQQSPDVSDKLETEYLFKNHALENLVSAIIE